MSFSYNHSPNEEGIVNEAIQTRVSYYSCCKRKSESAESYRTPRAVWMFQTGAGPGNRDTD